MSAENLMKFTLSDDPTISTGPVQYTRVACSNFTRGEIMETTIKVTPDERGESEHYEAYSMQGLDASGRVVWVEGIRKDRSAMHSETRAIVEAQLAILKGKPNA